MLAKLLGISKTVTIICFDLLSNEAYGFLVVTILESPVSNLHCSVSVVGMKNTFEIWSADKPFLIRQQTVLFKDTKYKTQTCVCENMLCKQWLIAND